MATISKLMAENGYYGSKEYATASVNHLYVGKETSRSSNYRSRITIPAMSSIKEVGSDPFVIKSMTLYLGRNDGGPTELTIGCSQSSSWDASIDAEVTSLIEKDSSVYQTIDLTSFAKIVAEYPSKWYLHFSATMPQIRLDSTGRSHKPYLMVTWEKAAATITGDYDTAELGKDAITFTIEPEVDGETHTLTYSIGETSGTIAERVGNSIVWTPPYIIASEITDSVAGTVEIRMTVYDADGNIQRTEVYYQTVTVPASIAPKVKHVDVSAINSFKNAYLIEGISSLSISPAIDMSNAYGASIESLSAKLTSGQTIQWTSITETQPNTFTTPYAQSGVLSGGTVILEVVVVDSRGRSAVWSEAYNVFQYSPPEITRFDVVRCEPYYNADEGVSGMVASDVGVFAWVDLYANRAELKNPSTEVDMNSFSWVIIAESSSGTVITKNSASLEYNIPIIQDHTIFTNQITTSDTWTFTVTVTDAVGGTAVQYTTVAPGHAALSISPDKWGTAIGMVSKATKSDPRFEVAEEYSSHFYGQIYDGSGAEVVGGTVEVHLNEELSANEIAVPNKANTDTIVYTAAAPGVYLACVSERWAGNSSGYRSIALMKGNSLYARVRQIAGGSEEIQQSVFAIIPLAAGETIVRRAYQNSGSDLKFVERIYQFAKVGGYTVVEDDEPSIDEPSIEVPEYWQNYLAARAAVINTALNAAGSSRSAFLWYTDAHWTTNYGTSPVLLEYLSENTRMEKTFFGGDVAVEKTGEIEIIQAWQAMVGNIPNHHSVIGNHDNQVTELSASAAERAEFFFGPEQTSDMVFGTDATNGKMYYYIDNAAESTRYICLSTGRMWTTKDEVTWCVGALSSVPANWHIVVISHMWLNSDYSDDGTATLITTPPDYAQSYLDLFDAYNARLSGSTSNHSVAYNFTAAQAKIEFIIGGHIHQDYDFATTKGIPVILTECDAWQERDDASSASKGTTTESCVYGVVADYNSKVVKVINVGRGSTRTISIPELGSGGEDAGYTNWLTHVVASDGSVSEGTNYVTDTRISVSSGSFEERSETGWCTTGLIPAKGGDIIRFSGCKFPKTNPFSGSHRGGVYGANEDGSYANAMVSMSALVDSAGTQYGYPVYDADGDNIIQFTIPSNIKGPYIRLVAHEFTAASVLTVNQEIE